MFIGNGGGRTDPCDDAAQACINYCYTYWGCSEYWNRANNDNQWGVAMYSGYTSCEDYNAVSNGIDYNQASCSNLKVWGVEFLHVNACEAGRAACKACGLPPYKCGVTSKRKQKGKAPGRR
jgi:hypothetical protein